MTYRDTGVYDPEWLLAEAAAAVQSDTEADVLAEAAELLEAEQSRVRIGDRCRPGTRVRLSTCQGTSIFGLVVATGDEILVLAADDDVQVAVAIESLVRICGLEPALRVEQTPTLRVQVTWSSWLRRCSEIDVTCRDGWQSSLQVAAVGADHVDGWTPTGNLVTVAFSGLIQAAAGGTRRWTQQP